MKYTNNTTDGKRNRLEAQTRTHFVFLKEKRKIGERHMNSIPKKEDRVREAESLLNDPFYQQIPSNPSPQEIIEILSKNPSIISYISNLVKEKEKELSNKKLLLDRAEREYSNLIRESRLRELEMYRSELKDHLENEPQKIKDYMITTGCNHTQARDVVRLLRPDKPTTKDLDDRAESENFSFYNEEVLPLKEDIIKVEEEIDNWKVKQKLYENNLRAATSIKGLIESDLRNY